MKMSMKSRISWRLWVAAFTAGALTLACNSGKPSPNPYSCGNVTRGHCYAITSLGDHILGFQTRVYITENITPGNGFVTNEFWLRNYSGTSSWIEVGYQRTTLGNIRYFWSQNDENGNFRNHDLHDVPPDELGTAVTLTIQQLQPRVFGVAIEGRTTHFAVETNVKMWDGAHGGYAEMGQELAGTAGATAGFASFERNRVKTESGWKWFVASTVGSDEHKPPYGSWIADPTTEEREGGVFTTQCCVAP